MLHGSIGRIVPDRLDAESAVLVGDVVDRSVLFDASCTPFPARTASWVRRNGSEEIGEIARRVGRNFVAASDRISVECELAPIEARHRRRLVFGPCSFGRERRSPLFDGLLESRDHAPGGRQLAVQLLCGSFEISAFAAMTEAAEHRLARGDRDQLAGDRMASIERGREFLLVAPLISFELVVSGCMPMRTETAQLRMLGSERPQLVDGERARVGVRWVDLPRQLCEVLGAHLATRDDVGAEDLVWVGERGGPLNHKWWYLQRFKPVVLELEEIPDKLRFHDLRHTCVAFLIGQGAQQYEVMEHLGHTKIQTTIDTYGHLFPNVRERIRVALEQTWDEVG